MDSRQANPRQQPTRPRFSFVSERADAGAGRCLCENPAVTHYYELGAANERLTELRPLLAALRDDRDAIARAQMRLREVAASDAPDRALLEREREEMTAAVRRMERAVRQIDAWDVTLRDISTGLIDIPALANGRPIWLCWKLGEDDIAWWHELEAGIAGRKPLIELE